MSAVRDKADASRQGHLRPVIAKERTSASLRDMARRSLARLRWKLTEIAAKIVRHGRYVIFKMAEVATPRDLFADILRRIDWLRPKLSPA